VIAPAPGTSNASGICRVLTRLCGLRGRQVISGERQDAVDRIQRRPVRQQSRVRGRVPVATSSSASGRRGRARGHRRSQPPGRRERRPDDRLSHLIDLELVEVPAPGPVRELPLNPLLVWWGLDDATLTRGVSTEACAPPVSRDRRPGGHRGTLHQSRREPTAPRDARCSSRAVVSGWSTRHSLACGCERVRGRPAYSCQGLSPGLGRRGASGAGFSARQARRRKLGTEPADRPTSSERGSHHSPLRDPAAAASGTAATAHDRVSHPPSRQCLVAHLPPPQELPRDLNLDRLAAQGPLELGGPASDPGRLKAPHARPRLSRRASGAAGSLRGRARGGSRRSTVAREEREHELGFTEADGLEPVALED
jgi:hypothetical protein